MQEYTRKGQTCFFFSNIYCFPRKLFKHEAVRPSVQISYDDLANFIALKQPCLNVILAFYMIP